MLVKSAHQPCPRGPVHHQPQTQGGRCALLSEPHVDPPGQSSVLQPEQTKRLSLQEVMHMRTDWMDGERAKYIHRGEALQTTTSTKAPRQGFAWNVWKQCGWKSEEWSSWGVCG